MVTIYNYGKIVWLFEIMKRLELLNIVMCPNQILNRLVSRYILQIFLTIPFLRWTILDYNGNDEMKFKKHNYIRGFVNQLTFFFHKVNWQSIAVNLI